MMDEEHFIDFHSPFWFHYKRIDKVSEEKIIESSYIPLNLTYIPL